jgi:zinc protease
LINISTGTLVSPQAVRQTWNEAQRDRLDVVPKAAKAAAWAYTGFGSSGRVAKRETIATPGFVRVTFDNGVILNFKHTDFERDQVKIRVKFGAGRREIPPRELVAAEVGSQLFPYMGLGRNDIQDLQQLFAQNGWDATLMVLDDGFVLKGATTERDLKTQLQILTAFVSDPGFRSSYDARLPTLIDYLYRRYRSDPASVVRYALESALDTRGALGLPARAELLTLQTSDIAKLLKPALTGAPLEVTIVGDVDEAAATEYVAETFGALRQRVSGSRDRGDATFLRFPDHEISLVNATHEGQIDVAPERRREEVSLMLLRKVFDNRLRHRVRQEMGLSYAPTVSMFTPDNGDQGYVQALVETSPDDAGLVRAEVRAMAARLARGEIKDEEVEAARSPVVAGLAASQKTNDWWAGGLDGSAHTPAGLEEMKVLIPLFTSVTPTEVRSAAATWLARAPIEIVALPVKSHE